jgi:hypothetical protein
MALVCGEWMEEQKHVMPTTWPKKKNGGKEGGRKQKY